MPETMKQSQESAQKQSAAKNPRDPKQENPRPKQGEFTFTDFASI